MTSSLISASDLLLIYKDPKTIILDVSPASNKSNLSPSYPDEMIEGAHIVSIKEELANTNSSFPNTFPTKNQFDDFCCSVGINKDSTVIVYDNLGIYSAPRVWWIFKVMGFPKVKVLNGGLSAWKGIEGLSVPRIKLERPKNGSFESNPNLEVVKTYSDVLDNIERKEFMLIDARSAGRFDGTSPEPRAHLQSGNIKHSKNIPFGKVLNQGKLKSISDLEKVFESFKDNEEIVFSCGSGLTACILRLAADQVLGAKMSVYDGSWTEWAEKQKLFI